MIKSVTGAILGLALIVFCTGSAAAQAQQDGNWTILEISGDVEIDQGGTGIAPVSVDSRLGEGSVIRTRERGRLVLIRGDESIIVGPNTEISIPQQDSSWGTRILQSLGTALFKVQKKSSPHFEVVTPYMAAVVKGTSFTVNVRNGEGLVHVLEGAVQVTDAASGAAVMVRPGQTARTNSGAGLQLDGTPVDSGTEAAKTDSAATIESGSSDLALSETADAGTPAATAEASAGAVLTAPVGLVRIDVGSATNGLVRSAAATGDRGAAKSSSNSNGRGNGGISARAAVESARVSDRSATARSGSRAATRTALASASGNSGNNGNGNGNSGNGNSGNSGTGNGNSGNSGNSNGNSGNNGNGSGNSGNSGNGSGNSGNSGTGSGNSGSSGAGSGNSGSSGTGSGNSGSSGTGSGNSGSSGAGSGNSGSSGAGNGNSGNSGNGNGNSGKN